MRPTREKAKQTDQGFDFESIWKFLKEESPAGGERSKNEDARRDGPSQDVQAHPKR
jgi:hypothetical protein